MWLVPFVPYAPPLLLVHRDDTYREGYNDSVNRSSVGVNLNNNNTDDDDDDTNKQQAN